MFTRLKFVSAVVVLALSACSSGGDSTNSPSDLTPVEDAGAGPQTDPVNDADELPPLSETIELSDLFGLFTITYAFTGSEDTVFSITTSWGEENIGVTSTGATYLRASSASRTMTQENEEPVTEELESLLCNVSGSARTRIVCSINSASPTNTTVRFGPLTNGEATGAFKFCDVNETPSSVCAQELYTAPDGRAVITVESATTYVVTEDSSGNDLVPYLRYAKQGVPLNLLQAQD